MRASSARRAAQDRNDVGTGANGPAGDGGGEVLGHDPNGRVVHGQGVDDQDDATRRRRPSAPVAVAPDHLQVDAGRRVEPAGRGRHLGLAHDPSRRVPQPANVDPVDEGVGGHRPRWVDLGRRQARAEVAHPLPQAVVQVDDRGDRPRQQRVHVGVGGRGHGQPQRELAHQRRRPAASTVDRHHATEGSSPSAPTGAIVVPGRRGGPARTDPGPAGDHRGQRRRRRVLEHVAQGERRSPGAGPGPSG